MGYAGLRNDLNRFLVLLGTTIGLGVLANASTSECGLIANETADFPAAAVLEYEAFLTVVLVFAYVPAHYAVNNWESGSGAHCYPHDQLSTAAWYSRRTVSTNLLELDVEIYQRLQTAVFVLAPPVWAPLSLVIPKHG